MRAATALGQAVHVGPKIESFPDGVIIDPVHLTAREAGAVGYIVGLGLLGGDACLVRHRAPNGLHVISMYLQKELNGEARKAPLRGPFSKQTLNKYRNTTVTLSFEEDGRKHSFTGELLGVEGRSARINVTEVAVPALRASTGKPFVDIVYGVPLDGIQSLIPG